MSYRRNTLSPALCLLIALLPIFALPAGVRAQSTAEEEASSSDFFETVDVEIVNVDVWVTDKDGRPVTGLTQEDFLVYRNGEGVPIANFYAVSGDTTPRPRAALPAPVAESVSEGAVSVEATPEPSTASDVSAFDDPHRLWMIVYIDNANIDPIERNRVMPALRQFFGENLRPGDQAMIVTYDRGLKVRQPFTGDRSLLSNTLFEIEDDSGLRTIMDRERYDVMERVDRFTQPSRSLLHARTYAEELMDSVERTAEALERMIQTLAGLPGRKALIHVSSGVPMQAGEEIFLAVAEKWKLSEAYTEISRHDTTRVWERVNRKANAHRVVFHTLDAGGLRGMEFGAAEYGGFVNPRLRTTLDSVVPQNLAAPLRLMALETGGRAIIGRNEVLPALVEVAQDFRSFYSLGINSSGVDSGRYHELKVKLKTPRKGVKLRHRGGYLSKNMDTRIGESLKSAMLYSRPSNPFGVKARWGKPEKQGDEYLLPFQLQIPLKDLVLLPFNGKHELKLSLYVAAAGEDGEVSEVSKSPLGLRVASEHAEAARKESLLHTHKVLLSKGRKQVGVAVLDNFGRQYSIITSFFDIGSGG